MKEVKDIKFSVIMPVYGVERFIKKAIDSILNQTYSNYEIILVDDCSKDSSGEIAKGYAEKHKNIIYLKHEVNKGLSMARNTGLEKVTGDYVLFLDSDDYFECDMLETIKNSIEENEAEVIVFGFIEEYMKQEKEEISMKTIHSLKTKYFDNREFQKEVIYLEEETLYGYAWNKAYSVNYLKKQNLEFKKIKHIEDIEFNVRCFENIDKLNILANTPYHYVQHSGQRLTNKKIDDYFNLQKQRIEIIKEQQKRWNVYNEKAKQILSLEYFRSFYSMIERNIKEKSKKELKEIIKEEYNSKIYNELQKYCKPTKFITKILYLPIIHKNYTITLLYAKIIYIIKNKCGTIFSKLKQIRK